MASFFLPEFSKQFKIYFYLFCLIVLSYLKVNAQMVGSSAYIRATSVEVGINGQGGFEGVNTSVSMYPAGTHFRNGSNNYFGFVANPQLNNWASFDGDFFTPGAPENGWGITIGGTSSSPSFDNNCNGSFSGSTLVEIPGSIFNYSHNLDCYNVDWSGNINSGGNNLTVKLNYLVQQNDLFYTTSVSITNNGTTTIPLLYYYRSVDPDNNQPLNGLYTTNNTIENQPGVGTCNIACVSAKQTTPNNSYLGLAGVGSEFRVSRGGFSNRNGYDIWNAQMGLSGTVGPTSSNDEAISLAYKIQNLAPGATKSFKYVVILSAADKFKALNNLLYLAYPGSQNLPPASCTIAADTVLACGGSVPISISGPNVSDYSWSWSPTSNLSSSNSPSATANPPVPTTYTVTGSPLTACASPNPLTYVFVVKPMGTLPTTISSNAPICLGNNLSLTASGGAYYAWSGPNSFTSSVQSPTITNPGASAAGVYTAVITNTAGCTGTRTINVSFASGITATVSSNSPICAGNTLSLTATTSATSFTWTGPGGFSSNLQNPVINSITSSGTYTLLATASGSCLGTSVLTTTVIPAGTVAIAPILPVCNNGTISLTSPGGGTLYQWSGPGNYTASVQNPSITPAGISDQGVYSVSVTTSGCINTGTVNVVVNNPLSYSLTSNGAALCAGKTATLGVGGTGGSGSYLYSWSPTNDLSSSNTPTTSVTGNNTTTYTVTLSDANCPVTATQTTALTVTVNPKPVITIATSDNRGCEPFCTNLISNSVPTSANCMWRFSDGTSMNGCNLSSYCFPLQGVYNASLTVTDINGCIDSVNQTAFIKVDPLPIASFDWFPLNPSILINEVNFTDHSIIGEPMESWHWDFGDLFVRDMYDTSNIQNASHIYENVGTYTVALTVTNSFGCKDTITKLVTIEDDMSIYIPNAFTPGKQNGVNDVFNIYGVGFKSEGFQMLIFDRWGEVIFKTDDPYKGWNGSVKGSSTIAQGVYVYKITLRDYKNREKEYVGHITVL